MPAAAVATPERMTPTQAIAPSARDSTSNVNDGVARSDEDVLSDRRVVTLLAIGSVAATACVVGMIGGRTSRGPREPRLRLINKPKKMQLSVLVPPGPPPRLIPSDSPNAVRKRPAHAPVPRQTPDGTTCSGIVDYLAAFADATKASEGVRVDYLLGDGVEDSLETPEDADGSRVRQQLG
jgi:hypothetical protein